MTEDSHKIILEKINQRLGNDPNNLKYAYELQKEFLSKKKELDNSLSLANSEIPLKVSAAIAKAEDASKNIKLYKEKLHLLSEESNEFLTSVEPMSIHLGSLVSQVKKLEATKDYLESLDTIQKTSNDLHTCNDSEQSVLLLQQLYEMQKNYKNGHRGDYIKEVTHQWYNVLSEKLSKEFDDVLKLVKWPITSTTISLTSTVPLEAFNKFKQIVQYLFQIQTPIDDDRYVDKKEKYPISLPVRLMIAPLKKRFLFHFHGNRRTNRSDRPEWFLTQILSWLRDHLPFLVKNLQPIADNLDIKMNVQVEFTCGLVQLAVDKLYALLTTISSDDSLFSHAIDECLGFDRELEGIINFPLPEMCPRVVTVLTDARFLIRWLAVEKKFAIQKIDEMLRGDDWLSSIGNGTIDAVDESDGIPQGADWLISLLQTVHDRYSLLPQPGHRLQFLELQIELCEEVRVRLTQLIGEELRQGTSADGGRTLEGGSRLLAMLNVAHFFRQALLDWTHSVSYLQLHYYKKQFQCFTEMQHLPIPDLDTTPQRGIYPDLLNMQRFDSARINDRGSISLSQVESDAQQLAQLDADNRYSENSITDTDKINNASHELDESETGVFEELPELLGRLVDNACSLLCDDLVLEVKAASRDYRNQKWHYIPEVSDWQCRSLSPALCAPLGALSTRLLKLQSRLVPELFAPLWRAVAKEIDFFVFDEVVLECWWGPGGIQQFHFDMNRNLMPIFAQYTSSPEAHLPKIAESCHLLTLSKGMGLLLRDTINSSSNGNGMSVDRSGFAEMSIKHLSENEILCVINQRIDMNQN